MFAIDERASSFCAREMRGTLSMASTVAFFSASACISSGFCAGQMKLTKVVPSRISATSAVLGARTLKTMSAPSQTRAASVMSAPAVRYASSGKFAASPAPDSIATLNPSLTSFSTTSGTVATRFSPAAVSRGTPMSCAIRPGILLDECAVEAERQADLGLRAGDEVHACRVEDEERSGVARDVRADREQHA